jgi:hypothetical protein
VLQKRKSRNSSEILGKRVTYRGWWTNYCPTSSISSPADFLWIGSLRKPPEDLKRLSESEVEKIGGGKNVSVEGEIYP